MTRHLVPAAFLLAAAALAAGDAAPPTRLRILRPDGKPAAGARVWVYAPDPVMGTTVTELASVVADGDGSATVTAPPGDPRVAFVYIRDAAGRVGGGLLRESLVSGDDAVKEFTLVEVVDRRGRVTDAAGHARAGATVTPITQFVGAAPGAPNRPQWIAFPAVEQARRAVRTDADGRFTLEALPAGYTLRIKVAAPGAGETFYSAPADRPLDVTHAGVGTVRVRAEGVDPAVLRGLPWNLGPPPTPTWPVRRVPAGVRADPYTSGVFADKSPLVIPNVTPGQYQLAVQPGAAYPGLPSRTEPFEVKAGGEAVVTVRFGPVARVTGKVVDATTGKGVGGVKLWVSLRPPDLSSERSLGQVSSAPDGTFTAFGPAGWFHVAPAAVPEGYAVPPVDPRSEAPFQGPAVEIGKSLTLRDITLPREAVVTGRVVLPGNQPAAGAVLVTSNYDLGSSNKRPTVDASGTFIFKGLAPGESVALRARLGKAVNVPSVAQAGRGGEALTVEVAEANAAGFRGKVTGPGGEPIAGAKVGLTHWLQGVGRYASYSTSSGGGSALTDAGGAFVFDGLWPKDGYELTVSAEGYAKAEVKNLRGEAGTVREVPPVKLERAGLVVSGVVIGDDGRPVEGAEVFAVDGPARMSATSAAGGRFTLNGFYDAAAFVFARKDGYRLAAAPVVPGSGAATVRLRKADAPPDPAPVAPPGHAAAQQKLLRHLVEKMWEARVETNYGENAIRYLAKIDPAAARKWADEEQKRSGDGTRWGRIVDEVEVRRTLFDTARADPDEAVALLRDVKKEAGFREVVELGQRLLVVDKAKAARLAEEAVVRARQLALPNKIWALTSASQLAARAGNRAGAERIAREAADFGEKLPPEGRWRETYYRGLAAATLAPHDGPRSAALLDALTDPMEYNRFLAMAAGEVAVTDRTRAKSLLGRFRPDNSFYRHSARMCVAYEIAGDRPDEAEALVNEVPEAAYRVLGLVRLAELAAPHDRARAIRCIDQAGTVIDGAADGLQSWAMYSRKAGFAALVAVRGKELGHPDVARLVTRVLAARSSGQEAWGSPQEREKELVSVASALALIDPLTARQVLAGVAPPEGYVDKALARDRNWLVALALADPDRAVRLVDRMFERASAGRGGPIDGVLELARVLTAPDRYEELSIFGSLPREIRRAE
jgi:hypothetical protein